MNIAINLMSVSEVRKAGTEALGPIEIARYPEEYDKGGSGDYTEEKYMQPDEKGVCLWGII